MGSRRDVGNFAAVVLIGTASLFRDSWFADWLRYLAFAYILGDLLFRARAGYRRRRPYWTPDSWRRYLTACLVPAGGLLLMAGMMTALEWRLPMVGAARSATRSVWAIGTIVFMFIGAGGLVIVIGWLNEGEPSRQFAVPRWLGGRRQLH